MRVPDDLVNTEADAATRLRAIGQPWSFIQRVRLLAGGVVVEDITGYNRPHDTFNLLESQYEKNADNIMEAIRSGKFVYDISGAAR